MSEPRHQIPLERIDLAKSDDPRDVVHRTVACLAQGERVALAMEGVCGIAASALQPDAVAGIPEVDHGPNGSLPLTLLLKGSGEVADWVPGISEPGCRLARRAWPGPLTLVFPAPPALGLFQRLPREIQALFLRAGGVALQVPAHPFVLDVLRLVPGPIVLVPLPRNGPAASGSDDALEGLSLMIESRSAERVESATVVRFDAEGWTIVRPGVLDETRLTQMAGTIILFVCTGNTCRSPMAEALCKVLLARRLGCAIDELQARGWCVHSAGIAAMAGMPAATNAIDVVRARGGSLAEHSSRKLTHDLVRDADLILTMTSDHLETLLEHAPESAPRVRPLHPRGEDVADPVGLDRETYQRTAAAIESYLDSLLDSLGV